MKHSKLISAVILLIGLAGTQAYPTTCKGVTEEQTVLLPTPGNCSTYIECAFEEPVVMPCPEGLHWNDADKQCDFPEIAKCEEKQPAQKQPNSCDGVPSYIDVLLPNPTDCGSYIQCVHGKPLVRPCPGGLHWSVAANRCEWPEIANCKRNSCEGVPETVDVLLPNPDDCGSYIQCVHQKPVVRSCPPGLHWSAAANRCEWPNVAGCEIASRISNKNWTSCKGVSENETVLLPNPGNCSTYIECAHELPVVMPCPEGLHWNDAIKQCDFPAIAKCEEKQPAQKQPNSCDGVPSYIDVLLPNPTDCGSYIQCVHGKPLVRPCPAGLHWSVAANRCEWPEIANCKRNSCEGVPETVDVLLPNPDDCGSYIQCVHQKPVVRSCPPGLHWSAAANRCEWPNVAGCEIASRISNKNWTSCKGVPENETVLLPNPGNCSTYIECAHELPVVMPCPEGLHWNDAIKQCDFPAIAKCEEKQPAQKQPNSCDGVPSYIDVLLPNPTDCGSYIQCVHGKPLVRPCPAGLHWSVAANRCEWPEIANCKRNSCEGVPETVDVLLPNPDDCGSYIQCVHQKPVVRPCPPGLHWSAAANRCEWPNVAACENASINP